MFRCPACDVFGELGHDEREFVDLCVPVLEKLGEGGHHDVLEHGQVAHELLGLDSVRSAFSCHGAMLHLRVRDPWMEHFWNSMMFCVSVPVLSEKMYLI